MRVNVSPLTSPGDAHTFIRVNLLGQIKRWVRHAAGMVPDDGAARCMDDHCPVMVPPFQGVRTDGRVYCSKECEDLDGLNTAI